MTESRSNTKANGLETPKGAASKIKINTMKKGYQEMADINLSLSRLYFEVEREVESYYDRIAECE